MALKRSDLAGKTGTTNDYVDAWFCGYQPTLVGITWIGYDQPRKLGAGETGGTASLPIWINFMEKALRGVPEQVFEAPPGLTPIHTNDGKDDLIYEEKLGQAPADTHQEGEGGDPTGAGPRQRHESAPGRSVTRASHRGQALNSGRAFEPDRAAGLSRGERLEALPQLGAITGGDPAPLVEAKMEAPQPRGNPDLAGGGMAVDDHLAAIIELDLQHASGLLVDIELRRFESRLDTAQFHFGQRVEFRFVHPSSPSCQSL